MGLRGRLVVVLGLEGMIVGGGDVERRRVADVSSIM